MPTAAGPNTFGEKNLVFGYDLGDLINSYKGEPTTNLVSTMGYTGFYGTSPVITQLGPDHYRLSVGGTNSGLYYSMGVQTGTWVMSYEYKAIQGDPGLGGHVDGTYGRWYVDGIEETGPTDGLLNLRSTANDGEWHKIYRIISNTNSTRNGGIFIQITRKGAGSYPAIAEIRNVQIENKARPTQYAGPSGTRSFTQGLINLTGNSTIDLTNVSFDSDAQMTFDGTDDYLTLPDIDTYSSTAKFTIEGVVRPIGGNWTRIFTNGSIGTPNGISGMLNVDLLVLTNSSVPYIYLRVGSTMAFTSTQISTKRWSDNDFTMYFAFSANKESRTGTYLFRFGQNNGLIQEELSGTYTPGTATGFVENRLGAETDNESYAQMDMYTFKMYDRELSLKEMRKNYNAIKGRFNI